MVLRHVIVALTALVTTLAAVAAPVTLEGQTFDDPIELANSTLQLNGVGLRAVAWLKGYAAGLYLRERADTPAAVLATAGAKRLQLRMLIEVNAEEFARAVDKGMRRNVSEAELARITDRMLQFESAVRAIGVVKPGDVVNLDYVPGQGMTMTLNGTRHGSVLSGDDFYAAVLRIFIGDAPVDANLKAGLLGRKSA